jgi:hypothetical protein
MPRIPIPLVGGSSYAGYSAQQSGRTVNLYPVMNGSDAKAPMALHHVPGFSGLIDVSDSFPSGTGTISVRGMHRVGYNRLFFVANQRVYEYTAEGTLTLWANLATFSGRVGISDNNGYLVIGDNSYWTIDLNAAAPVTPAPVLNSGAEQLLGNFPRWVDGYTLYPHRNASSFSWSALDDPTTVNGLDFATAEGDPDNINNLIVSNRELVFLGGRSTEFWGNSGDNANPFQRIGGGFQSYGIACRHSAVEAGGFVVFVGRHTDGEGQVVAMGTAGTAPQRISTPAVERDVASVLQEQLQESVSGFFYEDNGARFYVLNLPATEGFASRKAQPSKTWVYDFTTQAWHERAFKNPVTGLNERIKADHHALWLGKHVVSTYDDAAMLQMNLDTYTDVGGVPLVKFRESAGPVSMQGKRFKVQRLGIEMQVGVGLDGDVQGSDPRLMVQHRWGHGAWSNEINRDIGRLGAGKTTVHFGQMGMGQDFMLRASVSDPVPVVITGAWADVEVAA